MSEHVQPVHYFNLRPWHHWVPAASGLILLAVIVLKPDLIPYSHLGVVGDFLHYVAYQQYTLLSVVSFGVLVAHIGVGSYGFVLSRRMNLTSRDTMLWTLQGFVVGFTSLLPLRAKYKNSQ